jgi:hypothetical protein
VEVVTKVVIILIVLYGLYKWLSLRRKTVKAYIHPGMFEGKPLLHCSIANYFGTEPIIVNECHLIVDEQLILVPVSKPSLSLPRTVQISEGVGFSFDPVPLVTRAREMGQENFRVRAFFQDSADRTYLSKRITIDTDPNHFIRIFEDEQEHLSQPAKITLDIAQEITEQLDQQLVGIPHIVLALVREQNGVGGYVLRELGLSEDFLLNLAKDSPNLPRNHSWPQPYRSAETQELVNEYMAGEARKMRQRCHGTGHLLLGLTRQKNEAFLVILNHLEVQPRQLRMYVYDVLRKGQNLIDHPTLPPQGLNQYIWAVWYSLAHTCLIIFWRVIMRLFPDVEL